MKVLGVVVLYGSNASASKTINSLQASDVQNAEVNFNLIIYDNNLNSDYKNSINTFKSIYRHDPRNEGLAVAYNYALEYARNNNFDWLLLLDQDSSLPGDYFEQLIKVVSGVDKTIPIMAIVPKMKYFGKLFSPARSMLGGIMRPIEESTFGVYEKNIFAVGSGSLINVELFNQLVCFSEEFPVDSLDRWLYESINKIGGLCFVSNIEIEHELSVMDFDKFMSEARYYSILFYEKKFMKMYRTKFDYCIYTARMFIRAIKLFFIYKNKKFSLITMKFLFL